VNLLEQINSELSAALAKVLDLEDQQAAIDVALDEARKEFNRLNRAFKALTGEPEENDGRAQGKFNKDEPQMQLSNVPERQSYAAPVQVQPSPRPLGPVCNGCGGEMEPGYRTLGNGKVVNLWMCKDSGCNNETLA
jgi:hypothetical protein